MVDFSLSEEHKALIDAARRFTKERIIPVAAECDRESRFPMDVFKQAWELGLVNVTCPAEYGGPGLSCLHAFSVPDLSAGGRCLCGRQGAGSRTRERERRTRVSPPTGASGVFLRRTRILRSGLPPFAPYGS